MTKPVAVFRSGVIRDSRHIYTYTIPSDSIKTVHGQWRHLEVDATGRDRV
jgi:hypothetical protein